MKRRGKGLNLALANTLKLVEVMIEDFVRNHDLPEFQASVNQDIFQLQLPDF